MKHLLWLIFLYSSNAISADLELLTDRSRATDELRIYIQNTGSDEQTVLTNNLALMLKGDTTILFPQSHALIKDKGIILLKESIANFGAVTLKPGEVTYINIGSSVITTDTVTYEVKKKWANLHEVWAGEIEATIK
jgi:archaellum component FlaG (FlaF/FlaG flagellin family)